MTGSPLVSVIIPCFNKAQFVAEAVESVLRQSYRHVEVIAIDDGSTDGTWDVLEQFGNKIIRIRQSNQGTAAARQRGLEIASGELIGLLDHDDRWLPRKLERQVPLFAHPETAIVTGPYYVIDESGCRIRIGGFPKRDGFDVHAWKVENHIGTVNTLFRKSAALEAGGFDTAIRGCDDWDLWIRIADHYTTVVCDEPLAEYRSYPSQQSRDGVLMYKNRMKVLRKYRRQHPGCVACEGAYREGVRRAKAKLLEYARALTFAGFSAYEEGDFPAAWRHYRSAIAAYPRLLLDPRILRILLSLAKRTLARTETRRNA